MPADPSAGDRARASVLAPAVASLLALCAAAAVLLAPPTLALTKDEPVLEYGPGAGVRWLRDDFDLAVYSQRGSFAARPGARPYVEVPSEYPQLATYLFALPYAFAGTAAGYRAAF